MIPDFNHKTVLDLGCGYGWHCRYAINQGATGSFFMPFPYLYDSVLHRLGLSPLS